MDLQTEDRDSKRLKERRISTLERQGSSYAKRLIPKNVLEPNFIYRVNFEAGNGRGDSNSFSNFFERSKSDQRLFWSSPSKVELFKELIGELKNINEKGPTESCSSVSEDMYGSWNETLCKIIILASFTKINQAKFKKK